jgi:hypothetical protein
LCRAGNMAATPIMEDEVVVVASEEQRRRVQGRWPAAVVVGSPEEFGQLLGGGIAAWQAYRDQVVGDQKDADPNAAPARGGTQASRSSRSPRRGR